ncbi:MAG: hypothetical protein ABSB63_09130 [Spirochaetia bacterium]
MKQFLRLPRLEVLIIAGASVLAFIVTLAVISSSGGARTRRLAAEERQALERTQKPPALTPEELALAPEDFLLPLPQSPEETPHYVPFRPRLARWSAEVVGKYWIPPRQITLEVLQAANDQNMRRLFEKVQ